MKAKIWKLQEYRIKTYLDCADEAIKHNEPFSAELFLMYAKSALEATKTTETQESQS